MTTNTKQWFRKNVGIIQLVVTFCAMIVAIFEVIENPGRLAILLGLVAVSVGFGASLAILVSDRYHNRKANAKDQAEK
jgi:hypothetical protein